jgi:hypothetical protein
LKSFADGGGALSDARTGPDADVSIGFAGPLRLARLRLVFSWSCALNFDFLACQFSFADGGGGSNESSWRPKLERSEDELERENESRDDKLEKLSERLKDRGVLGSLESDSNESVRRRVGVNFGEKAVCIAG